MATIKIETTVIVDRNDGEGPTTVRLHGEVDEHDNPGELFRPAIATVVAAHVGRIHDAISTNLVPVDAIQQ